MSASALSFRGRIFRSGSWSIIGFGGGTFLRMLTSLIMTRLLTPEVFGVAVIAVIVQVIVALLADVGVQQTVIQSRRGDTEALLNTAWTVQVIRGFMISGVCVIVAAALYYLRVIGWVSAGSVYASELLPPVIAVSCLSSVFVGFRSTKYITAHRDLNLKRVEFIEIFSQLLSFLLIITVGWYTRSIWALIAGGVAHSAFICLFSHIWLPGRKNRFAWDHESLLELKNYGKWVLLSSGIFVIAMNADRLLLGGWTDAATLGLYSLAFNLATMCTGVGEKLFTRVGMPAMSEKVRDDPDALRSVYFGFRLPFDIVFLSAAGFLFAAGHLVIEILYDDRYLAAGGMLQVLSFVLVFARYSMAFNAYLAIGQPRYYFYVNVVKFVAIFTALPLANWLYGFEGVIWAFALHMAPTVPLVFWLNRRHNLNDFRFELVILLAWPAGYFLGRCAELIFANLNLAI